MSKWMYIAGAVLIAGFAVLIVMDLQSAATPYVTSVREARKMQDRPIQFMGDIIKSTAKYDDATDELSFQLRDREGDTIAIRFKGVKPANFDSADKAVVVGNYRGDEFIADDLRLKCPSKYEGSKS